MPMFMPGKSLLKADPTTVFRYGHHSSASPHFIPASAARQVSPVGVHCVLHRIGYQSLLERSFTPGVGS